MSTCDSILQYYEPKKQNQRKRPIQRKKNGIQFTLNRNNLQYIPVKWRREYNALNLLNAVKIKLTNSILQNMNWYNKKGIQELAKQIEKNIVIYEVIAVKRLF